MELIILSIITTIFCVILFIALKELVTSMEKKAKEYYLRKISDYDSLLFEKQILLDHSEGKITSDDFKNIHNDLKKKMESEDEKIIKDFLKNVNVPSEYNLYSSVREIFNTDFTYELSLLDNLEQIKVIKTKLTDENQKVLAEFLYNNRFVLNDFIKFLDNKIKDLKPVVEIITSKSGNKNYEYLSPFIKMVYSSEKYDGFYIKYDNHLYDYSKKQA